MSRYHNPQLRLSEPWEFPAILWRVPWWPVRLYLHAGDRFLFFVWWHSRRPMWWLEARAIEAGLVELPE